MIRGFLYATLIILSWGILKSFWEFQIDSNVNLIKYGSTNPASIAALPVVKKDFSSSEKPTSFVRAMRDNLGQGLAIVALGGFRGLAANFVWIGVHEAWMDRDWVRLRTRAEICVQLEPRSEFYWDMGSWHMAWNASTWWENYTKEPNENRRKIEARRWIDIGRDFLLRGININPERSELLMRMGDLYAQRLTDYHSAYLWYAEAAKRKDAPLFASRLAGRWLMKGGEYEEAYKYFKDLWKKSIANHETSITHEDLMIKNIRECENQLHIPPNKSFFTK